MSSLNDLFIFLIQHRRRRQGFERRPRVQRRQRAFGRREKSHEEEKAIQEGRPPAPGDQPFGQDHEDPGDADAGRRPAGSHHGRDQSHLEDFAGYRA